MILPKLISVTQVLHCILFILVLSEYVVCVYSKSLRPLKTVTAEEFDERMHLIGFHSHKDRAGRLTKTDSTPWYKVGQSVLQKKLKANDNIERQAKNIIFFMGDGMSLPTATAARILKGQLEGSEFGGEEAELNFEQFPHVALSKTFCVDGQVADSACSATAYLCGTKGNMATIGVLPNVPFRDCQAQMNKSNQAESIFAWAQAAGKSTGLITTTRVTHASPAGAYAHIADRVWESDRKISKAGIDADYCDDIAEQLILGDVGKNINVILGGGRRELTPTTVSDIESEQPGRRRDGKNLIKIWQKAKFYNNGQYVWNREQLLKVDTKNTDYLMGLFSYDHMDFVVDADSKADPSLPEMTRVAIEILSKNPNGFFLFVEGGRIDHAHHATKAQKALIETLAFDAAVATATQLTSEQDTLTVVTADHAHTMTISGYPRRGNSILGFAGVADTDDLPYTTLSYANGPGFKNPDDSGFRYDLSNDELDHPEYRQMTGLQLDSETHGGDDVIIYSKGPFAHLLSGVQHQFIIPHVLGYAACIGPGLQFCSSSSSPSLNK